MWILLFTGVLFFLHPSRLPSTCQLYPNSSLTGTPPLSFLSTCPILIHRLPSKSNYTRMENFMKQFFQHIIAEYPISFESLIIWVKLILSTAISYVMGRYASIIPDTRQSIKSNLKRYIYHCINFFLFKTSQNLTAKA